jgi:hypothetical protein
MALYQGYDGGKINVNISGGSGVDKNGFTMKGDIEMDGNEVKGLGAPTDDTSAVTKKWVDDEIVKQASVTIQPAGFTMNGDINMGGNVITNVTPGSDANNAATLDYVRSQSIKHLPLDGTRAMSGNLNMGSNEIKALGNPTTSRSAVTLEYMTGALNRPVSGLDIAGDIDMKNHEIKNLSDPTTDESAVNKKWVADHVSGSSLTSSGFTMTGNIDMGEHSITGLAGGSVGDTAALSSKTIDTWGLQFVKRDGGTLASNLDANSFEITRVANPTTDGSAVSKKWVTDHVSGSTINTGGFTMTGNIDMGGHTIEKLRLSSPDNPNRESVPNTGWVTDKFMSKVGGLVEGDIDMGDSSDIVNLRDPTNAKDAVNKQWVTNNFARIIPSGKYVEKLHHKAAQWVWGYSGVSLANTKYHAFCHNGIPPSWRTDTINSLANINLETITIKSNSSILADITNVNLELILRVSIYVKQSNGKFVQQKKDIVLGTIDLARLQNCYFLGTYQSDGRSTACYAFKGNSEYYIGGQSELVDNTMAWCVIVKPEQSMPAGKSMDMSFCWSLLYSGPNGG